MAGPIQASRDDGAAPRASSARTACRATFFAEPRQPAWAARRRRKAPPAGSERNPRSGRRAPRREEPSRARRSVRRWARRRPACARSPRRCRGPDAPSGSACRRGRSRARSAARARPSGFLRLRARGLGPRTRRRDPRASSLGRITMHAVANVLCHRTAVILRSEGSRRHLRSERTRSEILRRFAPQDDGVGARRAASALARRLRVLDIRRCRPSKRPVKSRFFRSSGSKSTPSS